MTLEQAQRDLQVAHQAWISAPKHRQAAAKTLIFKYQAIVQEKKQEMEQMAARTARKAAMQAEIKRLDAQLAQLSAQDTDTATQPEVFLGDSQTPADSCSRTSSPTPAWASPESARALRRRLQ
jgi:uncharacterized small protein (DUF1192 family)